MLNGINIRDTISSSKKEESDIKPRKHFQGKLAVRDKMRNQDEKIRQIKIEGCQLASDITKLR